MYVVHSTLIKFFRDFFIEQPSAFEKYSNMPIQSVPSRTQGKSKTAKIIIPSKRFRLSQLHVRNYETLKLKIHN